MSFLETYALWRDSPALSEKERDELLGIEHDEGEIESRFHSPLEFGTAGLRGVMGLGIGRMNVHVVRHTTQALCELILSEPDGADRGLAICFDSRINSREFAREAARVAAGNGVKVRIFESLRPTPELSFAVREYGCAAGINITASHNPKEYNGYKVYWSDGAQVPPSHAAVIAEKMAELDIFSSIKTADYDYAVKTGLITVMGDETDELFLENVMAQANGLLPGVRQAAKDFKLVYTPFHGAGYRLVPEALSRLGIRHVISVQEQMEPDGMFPTVVSPNPENPEGFYKAISIARRHNAGLIIGTDPDADRVGVLARDCNHDFVPVTGNQIGVLLLDYIIGAKKRCGTMPENPVALKTIVTTEMARRVAEENAVRCIDTFTGFKFMAEKKNELEQTGAGKVIFSYEESYGYMIGDFVRDKDAVTASMLIAEMAAWYFSQNMTLIGAMDSLYEKYGFYGEKTLNIMSPGLDGLSRMRTMMTNLRKSPPREIVGIKVVRWLDYDSGESHDYITNETSKIELSGSNVLRFETQDETVILVRPSGTEPKVKVYILTQGKTRGQCDENLEKYSVWADELTKFQG